jgi:hypothetical protein
MTRRSGGEAGFVLIAAIWFVALLALLGVVIAGWMARSTARTAALADRFALQAEADDAVNRVAWLMASNFFSQRGLELLQGEDWVRAATPGTAYVDPTAATPYLALDDRPYRMGPLAVRLQDLQGLFDLNTTTSEVLDDLLRVYQVPYTARGAMIDRLLAYAGRSESRDAGGDSGDYLGAGRPPPRDALLLTPWEAARVLGWDAWPQFWQGADPLAETTTTGGSAAINLNTAPALVLGTLPGFDDQAIAALIDYRRSFLLSGPIDIDRATGVDMPYNLYRYAFFPDGRLRLTLTAPPTPFREVVEIRQTPLSAAPYRVDYAVDLPESGRAGAAGDLAQLPAFPPEAALP